MKKKFVPCSDYTLPRIRKGERWSIGFSQTDPSTGRKVQFNRSYGLNRISDKRERTQAARVLRRAILERLPEGYPFLFDTLTGLLPSQQTQPTNLKQALDEIDQLYQSASRHRTRHTYKSCINIFSEYCKKKKLLYIAADDFTEGMAVRFMDYIRREHTSNRTTINTYTFRLKAIFTKMVEREIITQNPFRPIKKLPPAEKVRRALTFEEKSVLMPEIQKDPILLLAVTLLYFCNIRIREMTRMKVGDFDFDKGIIMMRIDSSKNKKKQAVTIPDEAMTILNLYDFENYPKHFAVFGNRNRRVRIFAAKHCHENSISTRHRAIVRQLKAMGSLPNDEGIQLYSWKDTSAQDFAELLPNIFDLQRQMRHANISTTAIYHQKRQLVNPNVKKAKTGLTDLMK